MKCVFFVIGSTKFHLEYRIYFCIRIFCTYSWPHPLPRHNKSFKRKGHFHFLIFFAEDANSLSNGNKNKKHFYLLENIEGLNQRWKSSLQPATRQSLWWSSSTPPSHPLLIVIYYLSLLLSLLLFIIIVVIPLHSSHPISFILSTNQPTNGPFHQPSVIFKSFTISFALFIFFWTQFI